VQGGDERPVDRVTTIHASPSTGDKADSCEVDVSESEGANAREEVALSVAGRALGTG